MTEEILTMPERVQQASRLKRLITNCGRMNIQSLSEVSLSLIAFVKKKKERVCQHPLATVIEIQLKSVR